MNYQEAMDFLASTKQLGSVPGLDRIISLMEYLGDPHKKMRYVHVTGTNGKGSTCACLSSILTKSGYRTGMFSSPYLLHLNEEISIDGRNIADDELAESLTKVRDAIDRMLADGLGHPTEFEITLGAAFQYFYDQKCDIVVLEVGLGGRGDATNIINAPEVAVFVPISLDHTALLGNTIAEIADEKSGIIKPGCTVITAKQPAEAYDIIARASAECSAPLYGVKEYAACTDYSLAGQALSLPATQLEDPHAKLEVTCPLLGSYQNENITVAIYVAYALMERGWNISENTIRLGIANTVWPGRFEVIHQEPAVIIDGAHNPDGLDSLVETLERYAGSRRIVMVTGILADKDYRYMMSRMIPHASKILTITVPNPRALPADKLAECVRELGGEANPCDSIEAAIKEAVEAADNDDIVLAFGSLYFIGYVREMFI